MAQLFTMSAQGIVSQPSNLSVAPGALIEATNVSIDREGVIAPARGFSRLTGFSDPETEVRSLFAWNTYLIAHYDDSSVTGAIAYRNVNDDSWTLIGDGYEPPSPMPRIHFMQAGESLYWTTDAGVYVLDSVANEPRIAGGVRGLAGRATLSGTSGFMPPDEQRSYRVLWIYEDATGRLVRGAPSDRMVVANAYKPIAAGGLVRSGSTVTATFATAHGFTLGQTVLLSPGESQSPVSRTVNAGQMLRTGSSVAVVTNGVHGYVVGQTVQLSPGETNFGSGVKTIVSVPTTTSFTYTEAGSAVSSTAVQTFTATSGLTFAGGLKTITTVPTATTLTYTEAGLAGASAVAQGMAYPSSNVSVTFPTPPGITKLFAWQLYRTYGSATALSEPDDNHYLVAEGNPSDPELIARSITTLDIRPDSLMQDALYTNPNQEGIQSQNEAPPLAKDLCLYKDTAFMSNIRGRHSMDLTLAAVGGDTGILVGTSVFFVKNAVTYQFLGVASTAGESGATPSKLGTFGVYTGGTPSQNIYDTANSLVRAINLSTGLNLVAYYTSTGNGLPGQILFQSLELQDLPFYVYVNDQTAAWIPTLPLKIEPNNLALGRTGGNLVTFRSGIRHGLSVGQSVTLEAYATQTLTAPIGGLSRTVSVVTVTMPAGHNYSKNQVLTLAATGTPDANLPNGTVQVASVISATQFTYNETGSASATSTVPYTFTSGVTDANFPVGVKTVNTVPDPFTFTYLETGTNGGIANPYFAYVTDTIDRQVSSLDVYQNGLVFSKPGEFWAFPSGNFIQIGDESEPILRVVALREAVFVMKTDGVFRVTDTNDGSYLVTTLDSTIRTLAPEAVSVLNNNIMVLAEQGVMAISDSGARTISRPIENELLTRIAQLDQDRVFNAALLLGYESDRKVFLWMPDVNSPVDDRSNYAFVYNGATNAWVMRELNARSAIVSSIDNKMYVGDDDVFVERKDLTNKDFIGPEVREDIVITSVASNFMSFTHSMGPGFFKVGDIMHLSPETVWRNVTEYSVIAAVDDDTSTVVFATPLVGLTTITATVLLRGYECRVRWCPQHGGDPTSAKQFSESQFFFARVTVPEFDISFSTDLSPGFISQTLSCPNYESDWSQFPWGESGWGQMATEGSVGRLYVPSTKQRGHYILVRMKWTAQAAYAEWQGIGIEGRAYTSILTQR